MFVLFHNGQALPWLLMCDFIIKAKRAEEPNQINVTDVQTGNGLFL